LSYKARLHPKVSNAELQLFRALSAAGLTGGMVTQKPIILRTTVPDFCWPEKRKIIYLDGKQAHASDKQQQRDQEIVELLETQGWDVLRIPYEPPMPEACLHEILLTIKRFLNVDEEK
jgi:very-short-patch-repair endonuclease